MGDLFHRMLNFKRLSDAQKIAISFLFVILTGAVLLMLPISNQSGSFLPFIDALFMAGSATCVTGLGTVAISETFTLFGTIVMLVLIQIGGLGLMTLMALFVSVMKKRLSIRETRLMKEMLNSSAQFDMRRFIADIMKYVALFEGIGALLLMFVMIPRYGIAEGIFHSIFLSVSAFCNAGFDAMGSVSLLEYSHHYYVVTIIMLLVILGGIGFAVWFDIRDGLTKLIRKEINWTKFRRSLSFHTRIVLGFTLFLIFVPALLWMLIEYHNPAVIGNLPLHDKYFTAVAEMVFLRTAGFTTFSYSGLSNAGAFLMMIVMFIGGSPGGTAGGIKTTTFLVIVLYLVSVLNGRVQTVFHKRSIPRGTIIAAMGNFFLNLGALFAGIFLLCIFESHDFIALCFEAVSALATVGSTMGITSSLTTIGKAIIIAMMYIGRIGITTLLVSVIHYDAREGINQIAYPEADIIVG